MELALVSFPLHKKNGTQYLDLLCLLIILLSPITSNGEEKEEHEKRKKWAGYPPLS